jgi:hypothetical protein
MTFIYTRGNHKFEVTEPVAEVAGQIDGRITFDDHQHVPFTSSEGDDRLIFIDPNDVVAYHD